VATSTVEKTNATPSHKAVALRPPAKLNLSLVVFSRRPDGYHELHSIMAAVNLHDDLRIALSDKPGVHLHCSGRASPAGADNLVHRAAELLAERAKMPLALDIQLHKRIPLGVGLGGASSDAAACLLGLNRLWRLNYSAEELSELAAQLGSDVPFFLYTPVALCTGRGEQVTALPHRCRRSVLLIFPAVSVPTGEVYAKYRCDDASNEQQMSQVRYYLRHGDLDGLMLQRINSLTRACLEMYEPVRRLWSEIEQMGIGPLQMSGSGSCIFATSDSPEQISDWARQIEERKLAEFQVVNFKEQGGPFLEVQHADI